MTTYPLLDVLKPVGEGIWVVDSRSLHAAGVLPLPVRITVMQLEDGSIILHSPTRHDRALQRQIEQYGPIHNLAAPNSEHWSFIKKWKDQLPEALDWAAPGLRKRRQVSRANISWHDELGASSQALWAPEIEQIEVAGLADSVRSAFFTREAVALADHRACSKRLKL